MTLRPAFPFGFGLAALLAFASACDNGPEDDPGTSTANVDEVTADAACGWQSPSDCWDIDLGVSGSDGVATLSVGMSAGDWDTAGGQSLPVSSVPIGAPWSIDYSPDNASGAWGHVGMKLERVGPNDDCCVECTVGQPCGNTCIEASLECHQPTGCACPAG